MGILDSLKPNSAEITELAKEEASIEGAKSFSPLSYGPILNSLLIGILILSSIPWLVFKISFVLLKKLNKHDD